MVPCLKEAELPTARRRAMGCSLPGEDVSLEAVLKPRGWRASVFVRWNCGWVLKGDTYLVLLFSC